MVKTLMVRNILALITVILLSSPFIAYSKTRISAGLPTVYRFRGMDNSIYSPDTPSGSISSGYMFHLDMSGVPTFGIESYSVKVVEANADDEYSEVAASFIDLLYQFDTKSAVVLAGVGYGKIKFKCNVTACSTYDFEEGYANQVFLLVGVPIGMNFDFHLSAHRVSGSNIVRSGSRKTSMDLGGMMMALGVMAIF